MDSEGVWRLRPYSNYLIYTTVSKALMGQANELVSALRAERLMGAE
jgi:hypothetical protein